MRSDGQNCRRTRRGSCQCQNAYLKARGGGLPSENRLLAWVSYTGDLGLPIGTAGYEDHEPFGSDIDQTTFDGKHRSLNGYNGVWEVIKPFEWLKLSYDGPHDFVPDGRGGRLQ